MRNYRPAWHRMAKCSQPDTDPKVYDTMTTARGVHHAFELVRCVEACEGCPVKQACAQWALSDHPTGVVVAGVPLPFVSWWTQGYKGRAKLALKRIAGGEDMHQVVRDELCRSTSETQARRLIEDRILAIARGTVAPPTTLAMITGGAHV